MFRTKVLRVALSKMPTSLFALLVFLAHCNLHYRLVKFFKLTFDGVVSNPGPWVYNIKV